MNAAVWRESALSVAEAINEWETSTGRQNESGKLEVEVESMVELTLKLSLFVSHSLSHYTLCDSDQHSFCWVAGHMWICILIQTTLAGRSP